MKILLTGSNTRQCNTARIHDKRIFDAQNLYAMLKTFADVDFCAVDKSTDFSKYDLAIVGYGAIRSFCYPKIMPAIYAIGKAKKVMIYLEDWKCPKVMQNELTSIYEKGYDYFLNKVFNKLLPNGDPFYPCAKDVDAEGVWAGIERYVKDPDSCYYLIPAFSWGNKKVVADVLHTKAENVMYFDESPYIIEHFEIKDVEYKADRLKKYFYCGLSNQDSWLKKCKIKDMTDCFGVAPYPKIPTEREVNQKHLEYLGIAIPEYYHAGSGWLRCRYLFGALSKNVFFLGDKDAKALGVDPLTSFDDPEAVKKAAMQAYEAVVSRLPSKEQAAEFLKSEILAIA